MKTEVAILFIGLVLHMNLDNSNTAVLPHVDGHQAAMLIWRADFTLSSIIPLEHKTVEISGAKSKVGDGTTEHLNDFDLYVPKLSDITSCTDVQDAVERHDFLPAVSAYFDYAGGKLDAFGFHDKKVMISTTSGYTPENCAACAVVWSGVPTGTSITMTVTDQRILGMVDRYLLKPGDVVLVRNAPPIDANGMTPPTGDHFPHNFDVMLNCNDTDHHVKEGNDCPKGNCFLTLLTADTARARTLQGRPAIIWKHSLRMEAAARDLIDRFLIPPSSDCTNSQYP